MDMIEFEAAYGDITKQVKLSSPMGTHGFYHVYIDGYYCGQIVDQGDKWGIYLNLAGELTKDDRDILIGLIEEHESKKNLK